MDAYVLVAMTSLKKHSMAGLQDGAASFCLHKVNVPQQFNQYEWDLSDSQGNFTNGLVLRHGATHCLAAIERKDGSVLALLHQGGFHTLNRFRWGSKAYRYCSTGCTASMPAD